MVSAPKIKTLLKALFEGAVHDGLKSRKSKLLEVKITRSGPKIPAAGHRRGGYFSWKLLGLKKINFMEGVRGKVIFSVY